LNTKALHTWGIQVGDSSLDDTPSRQRRAFIGPLPSFSAAILDEIKLSGLEASSETPVSRSNPNHTRSKLFEAALYGKIGSQ